MISVVVITYRREAVLVESLRRILEQAPDELIVVDQTPHHEPGTAEALERWSREGRIVLLHLERPSIPAAMNSGLVAARGDLALFLDDDIIPGDRLLDRHSTAHREHPDAGIVVGQVLQPGEGPEPLRSGESFRFNSTSPAEIDRAMAGNMSVKRASALSAGGFDENFAGAAYQFETEFARRMIADGHRAFFEPQASIRHLRAGSGGTRSAGGHLTTFRPDHAVGGYYYELVANSGSRRWSRVARRFVRSFCNRHHARRPWWIPVTFVAESGGFAWALRLWMRGPRLLRRPDAG